MTKKIENLKEKQKKKKKMIHKNFSKFYSFDIYVTFG